jgi:ABC-type transport system involved in Fe-S cluster assembly fused permease/ATPase subunit
MVWRAWAAVVFGELRDAVFVRVGQRALRSWRWRPLPISTDLSLRYHITRKTGGLSAASSSAG